MSGLGPKNSIDLGSGIYMRWLAFSPDRDLNPQYDDLPDNPKTGIIVGHVHTDGKCATHRDRPEACVSNPQYCSSICEGAVLFDTPENHRGSPGRPLWQVESLEPLTISPSILMSPDKGGCGLHGFIRNGRWEGC